MFLVIGPLDELGLIDGGLIDALGLRPGITSQSIYF